MKRLFVLMSLFILARSSEAQTPPSVVSKGLYFDWVAQVAIQDRGRVKPLDTFARESVLFVTGRSNWDVLSPIEVLFDWLILYPNWSDRPFVRVDYAPLKKELGLLESSHFFAPNVLRENEGLQKLLRAAALKQTNKEKLSEIEKKSSQIRSQLALIDSIVTGDGLMILPNPEGQRAEWFPLSGLATQSISFLPYSREVKNQIASNVSSLIQAYRTTDPKAWDRAVLQLVKDLRDAGGVQYPSERDLRIETHYNQLRPFRWAWVLYAIGFCALLAFNVTKNSRVMAFGMSVMAGGFLLHAYGFALRCWIAGRPPVTNMYESVIWVTWGCMLFSFLIWVKYRSSVIPNAAAAFAVVGLILADNLPFALDPSIQPLVAVLRSNFWLTIHVLTITLSYAAFAVSMCIGNVILGNYLLRPKETATIQQYSLFMYRAEQIGVVLLAAGTILGGVWADYSWGRFWGWDPKEVWALIALLLYIAVLHGRFSGWLRGFGFVTGTVMSFLGVLMAWYGVNFILGVGLHSYGFSSGGLPWVLGYVGIQLGFIGAAYLRYRTAQVSGAFDSEIFPKNRQHDW